MISVSGVTKEFGGRNARKTAVTGLDFEVPDGNLFTLLGSSGCGKTTTLRMIAGFERPTQGRIAIDGQVVFDSETGVYLPPNKRPIGMVFQSYAIWPHMSVLENVTFPLTVGAQKPSRAEARKKALAMLDLVGLADVAENAATALSGGQQQRVALARALVREPKVLLLDEPLSNLDAQLRERMREEIRSVQQALGITAVYVTHDQNEALAISDLVMLMDQGRIVETGKPQQIYRRPRAEFTANFIGVANAIDGTVEAIEPDFLVVRTPHGVLRADTTEETTEKTAEALALGESVRVFVRPENIALSRKRYTNDDWAGIVRYSIYQGESWDYTIDVNGADVRVRVHREKTDLEHGAVVHLRPDGSEAVVMRMRDGIVVPAPYPAPASLQGVSA